mgnify:CR=1 FL=1
MKQMNMKTAETDCEADGKSVLIVHRHALIGEGIARIVRDAGFRMLQEMDNKKDLRMLAMQENPDIIVLDWENSDSDIDMVKNLSEWLPDAVLIVLTCPQTNRSFLQAISAGAQGCLSVNLTAEDFVQSLRMLARGNLVISQERLKDGGRELINEHLETPYEPLSGREKEVLALVGRGATNREIAEELIISEHTVKVHLRALLNKLSLRNRQQAAAYATQIGLVADIGSEYQLEIRHDKTRIA